MTAITPKQAEKVLEFVKFMVPGIEPVLYPAEHEGLPPGSWSIAYEGFDGETPWPIVVSEAQWGSFYAHKLPENIFLEPMTSWSLGLYPEN